MNEHIEEYCAKYIESKHNPQFAILIKGEWGCGKTYFINKLISKYTKKTEKIQSNQIVYVSLFGISSTSEIDKRLFQKMHPVLSSEEFRFIAGFIRTIINSSINIGTAGTVILDEFKPSLQGTKRSDLEKKVIIIDDIERTDLSISQIFGYFSEYLNQLNMKLIFVGNEEKILEKGETNYREIKEKTIGVEFTLEPEIENAIESFTKELFENDEDNIKQTCLEVVSILECKNLRTVRQCLYNLKIFYNALSEEIIKNYGNDLSKIFINLFVQKSLNKISEEDPVMDIIVGFEKYKMSYTKYKEKKKEKEYWVSNYSKEIPLYSIWTNLIFNGDYSKQKIDTVYKQVIKARNQESTTKQKNLFVLIGNWRFMSKKEFKALIDIVNNEFTDGHYIHPGEILHYTNIMMLFCEWKLIEGEKNAIFAKIKKQINSFKERIIPITDWGVLALAYGGWAYSDEVTEVKEMLEYIKKISNENLNIVLKVEIKKDIKKINDDLYTFCEDIRHVDGTNKYYRKPYLSWVDIDDFVNVLVNLPIDNQSLIISSFEERYGITYANGTLYDEYKADKENLIKLIELYDNSLGDVRYNPPELLKRDISKRLHALLEYFN